MIVSCDLRVSSSLCQYKKYDNNINSPSISVSLRLLRLSDCRVLNTKGIAISRVLYARMSVQI